MYIIIIFFLPLCRQKFSMLMLTTTLCMLLLVKSSLHYYVNVELENLTDFLTISACREKKKLIDSERNQKFELVEVALEERLKLGCHYCDETDDFVPKMWYVQSRFRDNNITEVQLGMEDVLTDNRVYMTPDHVLVINQIMKDDAGLYYCKGIHEEDAEFQYNYLVDVVNKTKNVTLGELKDIKLFKASYKNASKLFATSNRKDYMKIREMGIILEVALEWLPWDPCDGCKKIKTRRTTCKLNSEIVEDSKALELSSKVLAKNPNISSLSDEEVFLIKSFRMSCFSLEFEKVFPQISRDLQRLGTFMIRKPCFGPCKFQFKSSSLPRYKNTLLLNEGDYFSLTCPESEMSDDITWRRDGVIIEPFSRGENILLDSFNNLIITYATEDESANYTCYVGKVRMQEILVIVRKESILKSSDFSKHLIYLGFILFLNFLLYISGLAMSYKRRHSFEKVSIPHSEEDSEPLLHKPLKSP